MTISISKFFIFAISKNNSRTFCKSMVAVTFGIPHFLLATTRLIKLVVLYQNSGQTVCMVNHLNKYKPPLGIEFTDKVFFDRFQHFEF